MNRLRHMFAFSMLSGLRSDSSTGRFRRLSTSVLPLLLATALVTGCSDTDADDDVNLPENDTTASLEGAVLDMPEFIGEPIVYSMDMDMNQSVEMGGKTNGGNLKAVGEMTMGKVAESADNIVWWAGNRLRMTGSTMGQTIDSSMTQTFRYTVSPNGDLLNVEAVSGSDGIQQAIQKMLEKISARQNAMQLFYQDDWKSKQIGDSWTEDFSDTIKLDSLELQPGMFGNMDLQLVMKVRYIYEGEVDTLNRKAVRLQYELVKMTIDGDISAMGQSTRLTSNSTGTGTFYYALDDKLQLASISQTKMNMGIAVPGVEQPVPMTQAMTIKMVRK